VKKDSVGSLSSVGTNGSGQSANVGSATGSKMPFMIGVAGGTASGKTTVCEKIMEAVHGSELEMGHEKNIVVISEDSFYRELDNKESVQAERGLFNFDHPDALDNELLMSCLADIRDGKMTRVPVYDFKTNSRVKGQYTVVYPSDVVLLEGILVFYHKDVRDMFDMKLFVDTDADTRLSRRVLRDIEERGRDLEHVLHQYTTLVKPAFEEFCLPTKKHADVIIPRGADNTVAISLIGQHIKSVLFNGNATKKRRSSTFEDASSVPCNESNNPTLTNRPPRRQLMTQSISLPAGNPTLVITQHERTPPRFLTQVMGSIDDLDPFQQTMLRHYEDSNFQMRPH